MEKSEIIEFAESLARKYNAEGLSPFPYEKITEDKKDIDILLAVTGPDVSGAIVYLKEEARFKILINKDKPKTRQNFTIAHELGHYFLHQEILKEKGDVIIDGENVLDVTSALFRFDASESKRIEIEAYNFAASLIMPSGLVMKAWSTLRNPEECARIFNVSLSAMSIRLERLGLL